MTYPAAFTDPAVVCCLWEDIMNMLRGQPSHAPYCYRIGMRLFAHDEASLIAWNYAFAVAGAVLFYAWIRTRRFPSPFLATLAYCALPFSHFWTSAFLVQVDPAATFWCMAILLATELRAFKAAVICAFFGAYFRESIILATLYPVIRRGWFGPLFSCAIVYAGLLFSIHPKPDEFTFGGFIKMDIVNILRNPFNITSALVFAFGPFAFTWLNPLPEVDDGDLLVFALAVVLFVCICGLGREQYFQWLPVFIPLGWRKGWRAWPWILAVAVYVGWPHTFDELVGRMTMGRFWPEKIAITAAGLVAWWHMERKG